MVVWQVLALRYFVSTVIGDTLQCCGWFVCSLFGWLFDWLVGAVYPDGTLCLDIIQDAWKPIYTVGTILTSIQVTHAHAYLHTFSHSHCQ